MKYKCLIFDHDDTTVNSTAKIHYPSFVAYMKDKRPQLNVSLDEYVRYNFEPGIVPFFKEICKLTDEDMIEEQDFWADFAKSHVADCFDGIRDIMWHHKHQGGYIVVASHSLRDNILRDYKHNDLPNPDLIFDWNEPKSERKPAPTAVLKTMERFSLKPEEILVIDDLKPGWEMANAAGVDFAAACWCFNIEENEKFFKENATYFCKSVDELKRICYEGEEND